MVARATDQNVKFFSQKIREKIGTHIRQLVLFGSRARGDAQEGSDYDFLVVLDTVAPTIKDSVLDVEVEFMNTCNALSSCMIYDEESWEQNKKFPIGINIQREGIVL